MPTKAPTIRFTVGTPGGARASTWRCWTPARGKSDVYLAPRSIAGAYHLSLHQSGAWHVGYSAHFKSKSAEQGRWQGGSRLVAQFSRPKEIARGVTLAFRVLVAASAVTIDSKRESLPRDLVWIPVPPKDKAIEVSVLIVEQSVKTSGWPGRRSMATSLVGHYPLASGDHLWIVHRQVPIPVIGTMRGSFSRFVPRPELSQRLDDCRAVGIIAIDGEAAAFLECKVEDKRFNPAGST